MDVEFVIKRADQLDMLAKIMKAIAEEDVTLETRHMAILLSDDDHFTSWIAKVGNVIGLPDLDVAVHMCAGYNPDNLSRAHVLLGNELWVDENNPWGGK